ncbi:MAG: DUF2852 domain-containing protein [Pseudomonadota bacterium]
MNTTFEQTSPAQPQGWFRTAERWLDERGKGAWIAAMVLGFIFFWPVGLVILFYMIATSKFSGNCASARKSFGASRMQASGNSAFDAYREETLTRLEEEQAAFETFLKRLREARDKSEFDQFMDERAKEIKDTRASDKDAE